MTAATRLTFLLDVDNTLLNNDRLKEDLDEKIESIAGPAIAKTFWRIYEDVREEEGYVDLPETVERLAGRLHDPDLGRRLTRLLDTWPFRDYLYPYALETVAYLNELGKAVILSDGDPTFQPLKIRDSGLAAAVHGNVVVVPHKEVVMPAVVERFPADHYVMVDDKPRILAALGRACPNRFTTVLVRQGKYASHVCDYSPAPDIIVDRIGDLRRFSAQDFLTGAQRAVHDTAVGRELL